MFSKVGQADNIGYLIAAEEIQRFLDDVADGKYDGKPMLYTVYFQTTENAALRARLGLSKDVGGIMVNELRASEDECPLRRWDVVTHIGDEPINQQGEVTVREDLRLKFAYLIPKMAVDGKIPLTVIRNKETIKLEVAVSNKAEMLMPFMGNEYPRFFIHGPMIFTPITQELASKIIGPWEVYLRYQQNPVLSRQFDRPAFPGEELVVLGYRLFPHEISKGYEDTTFALVHAINGAKVKNLAHLVELIRDAQGEYLTVTLCGRYDVLVFNRQELLDVTEEILADEGIRDQFSDDLKDVWEGKKKEEEKSKE